MKLPILLRGPLSLCRVDRVLAVLCCFVIVLLAAPAGAQQAKPADPLDWPAWRGPQQNSASLEKGLPESWNPKGGAGSNLVAKLDFLGTRSTPIIMNGKLYVLARDKPGTPLEGEKVVCVDAATLKTKWEYRFNVYLTDTPDTRVAWSSVAGDPATGRVYAQGVCGYFCCLDGETGKVVWDHSLHEEYGNITTYGGRTNVPIIFEDQLLISDVLVGWGDTPDFDNLARPSHRFMSFDKATGEIGWLSSTTIGPPDTSYSTPVATVIDGEAQLIFGGSDGQVWSIQPRTGKVLWHYPFSLHGLNVSPLVVGDTVYMAHSLENMKGTTKGAVVAIDAKMRGDLTGKEKWITYAVEDFTCAPLMVDGKLWVVDQGAKLYVLDPKTGEQVGEKVSLGARQQGSPVYGDGKVYVGTEGGIVLILKPTEKGPEVLKRVRLSGGAQIEGSPAISHGRVFMPTTDAMFVIGNGDVKPSAEPAPPAPKEKPLADDPNVAQVQVIPYDVLLKPGETHKFSAKLFNSRGQFIRAAKADEVKWSVTGPGAVTADGTYTAPKDQGHVGALVYGTVGEVKGKGRVRTVPPLPWKFDFNQGDTVPISWIGGRVRYVIKDIDGERAAIKLDVLPLPGKPDNKLGTRSGMYMGPASLSNYTIQADVRLTIKDGRLPDVIGLVNSGYTLGILPGTHQIAIYSWASHDYRTRATIEFEPTPDKWYHMKLRVQQQDGKALVQGKCWFRDEKEPDKWQLEMTDEAPQKSGSPGLFGNTQTTSFWVDNLTVTPND